MRQRIGDVLYEERASIAEGGAALLSDWAVVDGATRREFHVRQRLYSAHEIADLLRGAGFADVHLAGALDGAAPYDESAMRLVAIARA